MGKASEKTKEAPEVQSVSSDSESLASEEDVEDAGQEGEIEAPDLYRNSSLGMYVIHIYFLDVISHFFIRLRGVSSILLSFSQRHFVTLILQ